MTDTRPNLIFIIADQWSTQIADGSGHNHDPVRTPAIDRLAREGMRFSQSYSSFPLCCPARSSMFTGMMPHHHGIIDNEETYHDHLGYVPRREGLTTMGAAFSAAGYRTAYFGKEHAAGYGWDSIDDFGSMRYSAGGMLAEGSVFDQVFTCDALRFIERASAGEDEPPFYMALSLINPHDICKVLGGKVAGATIADAIFFCRTDDEPYLRGQRRPDMPPDHEIEPLSGMYRSRDYMYEELNDWTTDDWQRYLAAYCLLMEKTDDYIGSVLDALDRAGLSENTVVVFTTDHGEMVGSHGLISKTIFYEASAKTMLLVRGPGVGVGTVDQASLVGTHDLMPTLLDLCGVALPPGLDGRSFASRCYGEPGGDFDRLFAVNPDGRMLREGTYKYIQSEIDGATHHILFDLATDPHESVNRYGAAGYEAVSESMRTTLTTWLGEQGLDIRFEPVRS